MSLCGGHRSNYPSCSKLRFTTSSSECQWSVYMPIRFPPTVGHCRVPVEHGQSSTHLAATSPTRPQISHFDEWPAMRHLIIALQARSFRCVTFLSETWWHAAGTCCLRFLDNLSTDNRLLSGMQLSTSWLRVSAITIDMDSPRFKLVVYKQ